MPYSKIRIDFTDFPTEGEVLRFTESLHGLNVIETFKNSRSSSYETKIPNVAGSGRDGYQMINYQDAFNLDYNSSSLFEVATFTNSLQWLGAIEITAKEYGVVFSLLAKPTDTIVTITEESFPEEPTISFSPANLEFVHLQNEPRPAQNVTLTGDLWKIVGKPNFILTSDAPEVTIDEVTDDSGTYLVASGSGDAIVGVALDEYYDGESEFSPSDLSGTFAVLQDDVAFGLINWTVNVVRLSRFLTNPFTSGNLFFTKALDFLKFNSTTLGTYIYFDIEIKVFKINTYEPIIYNRNYKFPLFKGKGDFHIGTIVHDLLEEIQSLTEFVPDFKTNYYKSQYRPAEIKISFEEKTFGATVPGLINADLPMFKMAKGYKPFMTDGQLALLTVSQQEITRITPQSFIGTSFVYFGTPRIVVKKNNRIIEDFEIEAAENQVIYSYFRFLNDVKPGDSLEIIIIKGLETRSQRYLVFQNGMESTYFLFENDNGLIEPFEFAGRRRVFTPLKHITTPKFKNLYTYNSKVKTEIEQNFTINTGQLTKTDHRLVTAICKSLNVWCSFDDPSGPYFKIDSTTSKIANQDTSSSDEAFDIEFNSLENADASIYPR
jgi:hypothetical protein